jgi:cellulose synthase (UDP-forming)
LFWLVTRRTLDFQVTPKSGADERLRGRVPTVVYLLIAVMAAVVAYAVLGLTGWVPWQTDPASTIASGVWLALAWFVLVIGVRRIRDSDYSTSRRNAYRFSVRARVRINGVAATLLDMSVGGAALTVPEGSLTEGDTVELNLPGADPITMRIVRLRPGAAGEEIASLRVAAADWASFRSMSLWLFHTPAGVVEGLPYHVPAVAARSQQRSRPSALARQYGRQRELTGSHDPAPAQLRAETT